MEAGESHYLETTSSNQFYIFTSYVWGNNAIVQPGTYYGCHTFLPYHRDRLISAAQAFDWTGVINCLHGETGLERILSVVDEHLTTMCDEEQTRTVRKIKVCVYKNERFHIESGIITPTSLENVLPLPSDLGETTSTAQVCIIKLDIEPTMPSLFTTHKTSERSLYDRARRSANIVHEPPTLAEVLLFNPQNEVMECSLSTPYFFRNGQWVTPPLSSGGNAGVTRRLTLEGGLCKEQVILLDSLRDRETIWISNGVRGFIPATLLLGYSV